MGRNLIINGDFKVAQRGTSFTSDGYSLDRWYHQLSGGTSTTSQQTFALGSEVAGCSKYLKQATSTGANYCGLVYKVEDVKSIHQGKVTFSFYAKGTNPAGGSFTVRLARINTGTTFFDTPLNSTLTLTSTWQRFVYTFDVASFSGMGTIDNTSQLYISIHQPAGDAGTAAWELNLTGVQLENAEKVSTFDQRTYAEELTACQRYCQVWAESGDAVAFAGKGQGTTSIDFGWPLVVPLRASPTISQTGTGWRAFRPAANLVASTATAAVTRFGANHPFIALRVGSFPSSSFNNNYAVNIGPHALSQFIFDSEL
tara:strand:- start:202 stop:1140 length:939 start_codon:yes stop_codon:yes gene_type:complete